MDHPTISAAISTNASILENVWAQYGALGLLLIFLALSVVFLYRINSAKDKTDYSSDGKDPPFPACLFLLSRFCQGHCAKSRYRCHGKGELFYIGGNSEQGIAEPEVINTLNNL